MTRCVTPLYIEIAIHYIGSTVDFPRKDAPACAEVINHFMKLGLLERSASGTVNPMYKATDGLRLWVDQLCSVPFPIRVWIKEEKFTEMGKGDAQMIRQHEPM